MLCQFLKLCIPAGSFFCHQVFFVIHEISLVQRKLNFKLTRKLVFWRNKSPDLWGRAQKTFHWTNKWMYFFVKSYNIILKYTPKEVIRLAIDKCCIFLKCILPPSLQQWWNNNILLWTHLKFFLFNNKAHQQYSY